jgi:DNA uptake protein ComE-like DNA-binding protein
MRLPLAALFALLVACSEEAPPTKTDAPPAPAPEAAAPPAAAPPVAADATASAPPADAPAEIVRVNLNTATPEVLAGIPGMSKKMIHEFEEYRPYVSIQQFRKEIGKYVPADQVAAWEPHVYVPVDGNKSDAATLQQLPGIDAAKADALIAGRPYATRDAFLAAVDGAVPADKLAIAKAMIAP